MTETEIKDLLAFAATSSKAEFLKLAATKDIRRDVADVIWTAAKLMKKSNPTNGRGL